MYSGAPEGYTVPSGNCRVTLVTNLVIYAKSRTDGIVITTEELSGLSVRERNGRDCDYGRGTDGIVSTAEELIGL